MKVDREKKLEKVKAGYMKRIKQALLLRRKKKYSRILKIPENLS